MLSVTIDKITLRFKQPAGTSRGVLKSKNSWILTVTDTDHPGISGRGEISIIDGLSPEWNTEFEDFLPEIKSGIATYAATPELLAEFPSVRFGLETALLDFRNGGQGLFFSSDFTSGKQGIPINGLIWMGTADSMTQQIDEKLKAGFRCLKMKIGAIGFDSEIEILKNIRKQFSQDELMLRVDANGSFDAADVQKKLDILSQLGIHSIEQPIAPGNPVQMQNICKNSEVPIALDEELIGVYEQSKRAELIEFIQPQFLIFKPSLLGGIRATEEWIQLAEKRNTGWWITSALESNIGLNAIAQYTFTVHKGEYQGLGTGTLFETNFPSKLQIRQGFLFSSPDS